MQHEFKTINIYNKNMLCVSIIQLIDFMMLFQTENDN